MTIAVLVHTILFLVFWLTNLLFRDEVNKFLSDATGLRVDFVLIFLFFAGAVFLWSAVRLILRKKARAGLYNAIAGFFLVFFYGSFIVLFLKNPVQVARLGQLILYFRIFVDTTILFLAAWGVRVLLGRLGKRWEKIALIGVFLVLWLVPVFWTPGAVYRGPLPEKPLLIAHRGASTLAPENTLASMQVAAGLGVYGLETDITISYDGILYLMHDSTLERTTDVSQIFPGREKDQADSFLWEELSRLDAGSWFMGQEIYPDEPIPALAEMLQIVKDNDLNWIYDLRIPSDDHPFAENALDLTLAEIKQADVASHTWVLAAPDEISLVRTILPESILAKGLNYRDPTPPQELVETGYQVVNSEFGLSNRMIHTYQEGGLWINLWTVDEPWQYSRLWLAGANSVTSNRVQAWIALSRPVMAIPYTFYLVIWGLVGVVAAMIYSLKPKQGP